jgi:hypothetical protein
MKPLRDKLEAVARKLDEDKPKLHLFALVHRVDAPEDRWDLLVSSDQLAPWSMEALKYIADLLKGALTTGEIIKISQVVALPPTNELVTSLAQNAQADPGDISNLRPTDRFDHRFVIWPLSENSHAAAGAHHVHK